MNKLKREFLENSQKGGSCVNELVILPLNSDVGFEEYFDFKVKEVIKEKRLFSPIEQNRLLLTYPTVSEKRTYINDDIFDKFFESPCIVAKNQEFEGCFGIDITDYIGKTDDEYFERLMSYFSSHSNAVYLFILFTNNKKEIQGMRDFLSRYGEFRLTDIQLPSPKYLSDYTITSLRADSTPTHIKEPVYAYFEEYYTEHHLGFDAADSIANYFRKNGCDFELETVKRMVKEAEVNFQRSGYLSGYGY